MKKIRLLQSALAVLFTTDWLSGIQLPEAEFSAPMLEPLLALHGGGYTGSAVGDSPDPLVSYRWQEINAKDPLQLYTLRPVAVRPDQVWSFHNIGSLTKKDPLVEVTGVGSIQMDFGVESAAWLEFDSPDLTGEVEMSVSEYNEPGLVNGGNGVQHSLKTTKPVKYGNTYRLELNKELYEGVRFGWIHVRSFTKTWHLTAVRLVCQIKPTNYEGSFATDDPILNRIWYTGVYSVKLNLGQDSFGALLMDRGDRISWTGDAHTAQAAALAAFGNFDSIRVNLEHTALSDNGIQSYALYWVLSLVEYYRYSGDAETFDRLAGKAREKLAHGMANWDNPHIVFYGWDERLGAGFENPEIAETRSAYRALFIRVEQEFAWALGQRGQTHEQAAAQALADELATRYRSTSNWVSGLGLHSGGEAIDASIPNAADAELIYAREFNDPVTRLSYSPFNQYFLLKAMARLSKHDDAIDSIRNLWGGQLRYGGTTFFEVFHPDWVRMLGPNDPIPNGQSGYTSLCHAWGGGVTQWLSEEVLGIKPERPGFSTFTVRPHLGPTLTRVAGKMPTPHGPISVAFDASAGTMIVSAPQGTVGEIGIPKLRRSIQEVRLNGKIVTADRQDAQFVYLREIGPGTTTISFTYLAENSQEAVRVSHPPAIFVGRDLTTRGNWPARFGKDGFVLFSGGEANQDLAQLPEYVESVIPKNAERGRWSPTNDGRALPISRARNAPRAIGFVGTAFPDWNKVSLTLDLKVKGDREFQVALYFVDWARGDRKLSVEMVDGNTLAPIAPVQLVSNFAGGEYLIYRYHRSCRFRVNYVRGDAAVLNAMFFDPVASTGEQDGTFAH